MTRSDFIRAMKDELMQMLPEEVKSGLELQEMNVTKSNDQELHGLAFKHKDMDAAPTIYLDDAYGRFTMGDDLHTLAAELKDVYLRSRDMAEPDKVDLSYDSIRDKLTVRLLEIKRNRNYLASTPYMTVGHGLAMVCDIKMDDGREGSWRATVTQNMLEDQNYDKRELFVAAMDNARVIDPPVLVDMGQAMFGSSVENLMLRNEQIPAEEVEQMYVLTNESGTLGAAALFYPDTREHIADVLGESYTVLPSSQHEVLIVPDSAGMSREELTAMVALANREVVEPKDVLSDNIYHFNKEERVFGIATAQAEKGSMVAEAGRA